MGDISMSVVRAAGTFSAHHASVRRRGRVPDKIKFDETNEDGTEEKTEMDLKQFMKRFNMHPSPNESEPTDAYGTLRFPGKNTSAPYLRLSVNDNPEDALLFVKGMLTQKYGETYDRPSLILSVTGGARNFTLPPRLETAIAKGLRLAAQRTNAWVVTGGTNTGVMKLTGQIMEALSKTQSHFIPPTIGIATFGVIVGGADLSATGSNEPPKRDHLFDITKKDGFKAPLDPNHNLFMLVDDGTTEFGREITFRAAFEKAAATAFGAPVITIVVQGGPGTLNTALQAVRQGTPIVVVDGSGLAADVLAYAYNFMHNPRSRFTSYTIEDLKTMVKNTFNTGDDDAKLTQLLDKALECVYDPNLVVVYSLQESGIDEFDDCILKAIFSSHGTLKNKLKQGGFDEIESCINDNLMAALTHNKPHFVELYLSYDAKIWRLEPTNKKMMERAADNAPIAQHNRVPKFVLAIQELYENEAKRPHSHVQVLAGQDGADMGTSNGNNTSANAKHRVSRHPTLKRRDMRPPYCVERMEEILSRLVSKDFSVDRDYSIYPDDAFPSSTRDSAPETAATSIADTNVDEPGNPYRMGSRAGSRTSIVTPIAPLATENEAEREVQREAVASHILFLWAVCLDKYRMAHMFWRRGDQSIINALVASRILERLSTHRALQGPHLAEERAKMKKTSKKFEKLAVGVLEECHNADSRRAAEMLHSRNDMFNKKNAIRIAYDANSLAFLSHTATQSVINSDWYGQLKSVTSFITVLLAFFFPFFILPFIHFQDDKKDETQQTDSRDYFDTGEQDEAAHATTSPAHTLRRKFAKFYAAPYTRFLSDLLSHLALCILTSYFVLDNLNDTISVIEWILLVWFVALILEELRQMIFFDGFAEYISDTWNRLDLIMITLFFAGFGVRVADPSDRENKYASKGIHAFLVVVLWLRFMRYYALSKNLGPKLIMMIEMIKDVTTFIFLLIIFLIGYGIAAQSLLFPDEPFSSQTVINVLFKPYFQIYGELFLDDLQADAGCVSIYPFTGCGREEVRMVPFFLAVYVLVTNILLVNLLIAMFNDTYIKVQDRAEHLWCEQNYELFLEYKERPFLPAPLILITHAMLLFSYCFRRCCNSHDDDDDESKQQKKEHKLAITKFEEFNTEKFLRESEQEKSERLENRVAATFQNVHGVMSRMDQLLEHMVSFRSSLDRQIVTLKQEIHDESGLAMAGMDDGTGRLRSMTGTSTHGPIRRRTSSMSAVVGKKPKLFYLPPEEYSGSNGVKRFVFDASQVPWDVECPIYKPVEYTHPSVAAQPVWADPADPRKIKFNVKDEVNGKVVDRTSCHPSGISIDSNTGRPINPWGRTGMTGRGLLGKWGVNQAADTVVTRWKRSSDGSILERDGKKVLEFVAIQRMDNKMWAIPGGFVDNGEDRATASGREFMEEALGTKDKRGALSKDEEESVASLFADGAVVGRIYSEDPRNTDNAWVETTCVNFHDESGRHAARLKLQGGDDAEHARWMMVHGGLNLFASHRTLLRMVASYHTAYY
ncbi:nudix-type domain-containing protein 9 isoform b [Salpingoeca rosetta]|uniref:Nudix-type domain-containing protein 9 isoform b n=1 Tax=Salpingoeca rosetta (strain ATCC 50818 / BSB-021) TaxID=946362 RepID=F2UB87_SALR5|nr:nudix-type domain-containing protein 9 isoform b [Salpingoeca rosetta]EGD73753.1 nudix-type domain-containing protein 9 isoform b [Salpingoeca rosetta]|eukprot:XP_004993316.1 nudix-type domain-containing protein 9 isoform b [Salpingoeca rosetta]